MDHVAVLEREHPPIAPYTTAMRNAASQSGIAESSAAMMQVVSAAKADAEQAGSAGQARAEARLLALSPSSALASSISLRTSVVVPSESSLSSSPGGRSRRSWEDQAKLKVARELEPGDEFEFVFDFGDDWRHRCRVLHEKVDPAEEYGPIPDRPVPIWGWGQIPDQYGRESLDE